jgi:hypothetical protein
MDLTPQQQAFVDQVPPGQVRSDMAMYLAAGAEVVIGRQTELPEVAAFSVMVDGTDFWICCCESIAEASELAQHLGLRVKN